MATSESLLYLTLLQRQDKMKYICVAFFKYFRTSSNRCYYHNTFATNNEVDVGYIFIKIILVQFLEFMNSKTNKIW